MSSTIDDLVHSIQKQFIEKKMTLSVAESCTGGALASYLTQKPGASSYFLGGIIAYCNQLKINLLSVGKEALETYGAVDQRIVQQMATGVMACTGSDYALATSGIAGPAGGSKEKPVGTIWLAIRSKRGDEEQWKLELKGNRQENIECTIVTSLEKLLILIESEKLKG